MSSTRIQIYNKKTGHWSDIHFGENIDAAFEEYWRLSDEDDPDLSVELITTD